MTRFVRRDTNKYLKLGKKRKKVQKWRKPRGRHNKVREQRKGYQRRVDIGFGTDRRERKNFAIINNMKELQNTKDKEVILAKIGRKKRQEILSKAQEMKIKILNWEKKKQ